MAVLVHETPGLGRTTAHGSSPRADSTPPQLEEQRHDDSRQTSSPIDVLEDLSATVTVLGNRMWWALGAVSLAILAVGVDGTVLSVALPTLSKALHASESDLQ